MKSNIITTRERKLIRKLKMAVYFIVVIEINSINQSKNPILEWFFKNKFEFDFKLSNFIVFSMIVKFS